MFCTNPITPLLQPSALTPENPGEESPCLLSIEFDQELSQPTVIRKTHYSLLGNYLYNILLTQGIKYIQSHPLYNKLFATFEYFCEQNTLSFTSVSHLTPQEISMGNSPFLQLIYDYLIGKIAVSQLVKESDQATIFLYQRKCFGLFSVMEAACIQGNRTMVEFCIKNDYCLQDNNYMLSVACCNHQNYVIYLLISKMHLLQLTGNLQILFRTACRVGNIDAVQLALQYDNVLISSSKIIDAGVELAAEGGHTFLLRFFLDNNYPQQKAFLAACKHNLFPIVEKILDEHKEKLKASPEISLHQELSFCDALRAACAGGHMAVVSLLLTAHADCVQVGLQEACEGKHLALVKLLYEKGAVLHYDNHLMLRIACSQADTAMITFLMEKLDTFAFHRDKLAFLNWTVHYKHYDAAAHFLLDNEGRSMPHMFLWACNRGNLEVAWYTSSQEDVSDSFEQGLAMACFYGSLNIVKRLAGKGAKVTEQLAAMAMSRGHEGVAEYILKRIRKEKLKEFWKNEKEEFLCREEMEA